MEKIELRRKVLNENDLLAEELRSRFHRAGVLCLNLLSSPGSGKTSLLERTLDHLRGKIGMGVIVGDVQTDNDARRLAGKGSQVRAIETRGACHLDARMVNKALDGFDLEALSVLFIENVGNLVCPASFDLGEEMKVTLVSTAEGDDKPQKYPAMFARSSVVILNKTDLLPHVEFDCGRFFDNVRAFGPGIRTFSLSCRSGEGLEDWYRWLLEKTGEHGD